MSNSHSLKLTSLLLFTIGTSSFASAMDLNAIIGHYEVAKAGSNCVMDIQATLYSPRGTLTIVDRNNPQTQTITFDTHDLAEQLQKVDGEDEVSFNAGNSEHSYTVTLTIIKDNSGSSVLGKISATNDLLSFGPALDCPN